MDIIWGAVVLTVLILAAAYLTFEAGRMLEREKQLNVQNAHEAGIVRGRAEITAINENRPLPTVSWSSTTADPGFEADEGDPD